MDHFCNHTGILLDASDGPVEAVRTARVAVVGGLGLRLLGGRRARSSTRTKGSAFGGCFAARTLWASAHTADSDEERVYADIEASTLEILEGLLRETNEQFARYKRELGISG